MGLAHSPRIITDGLVLALDAGNTKSYPGSGTTWTDITTRGYNATLVNSPTYDSSGYFNLNGTNHHFTVSGTPLSSSNSCTILMWIYSAASQADYAGLFYNRTSSTSGLHFLGTTNKLTRTWSASDFTYDTGLVVPQNVWSMVGMSVNSTTTTFWLNDTNNVRTFSATTQTWDAINIGRDAYSNARCFNGRISNVLFYSSALSDNQVLQNFNALRGRFGL